MIAQLKSSQLAASAHPVASASSLAAPPTPSELEAIWHQLDYESCPRHYNFHMHTVHSDGQLTPYALVQQAIGIGLKGFAITDHHAISGYLQARDLLPENGPRLWSGVEITADLLGDEVHVLGYGFDPQHQALRPYLTGERAAAEHRAAERAIAALHAAGGLAILAHPFRYKNAAAELVSAAAAAGIDGLEAYYSYKNSQPWVPSPVQTEQALDLAVTHALAVTCGTDTHGSNLLRRI